MATVLVMLVNTLRLIFGSKRNSSKDAGMFLLLLVLGAGSGHGQSMPKIYMNGAQSPACLRAAEKVLYIESRVGVIPGHVVHVYCNIQAYTEAIDKLGISYAQSPDGTSLLKARISHLNAESILRITGDNRHRGDFLIAHEIGHFATDSPLEWRADAWAADNLKKYVKVSYEDYKLTASK